MRAANSMRWIESTVILPSPRVMKFLPLPGGEGWGEGERKQASILQLESKEGTR